MKKVVIAVLVVFMFSSVAMANTVREDCGCGLGGMAIGEKEGLIWKLVGTFLNGICGNQTFAMSTGTLDCGEPSTMAMMEKLNIFVADNMDVLAVDIAQGQGESLDAVAEIAAIPAEKRSEFYSALQSNFGTIYPDADVTHETVVGEISRIVETI